MLRLASEQLESPPWEPERLVGAEAAAAAPLEAAATSSEPILSVFALKDLFSQRKAEEESVSGERRGNNGQEETRGE